MGKKQPSIVYFEDKCAGHSRGSSCEGELELHHIFYGAANRRLSDKDGLTCYLCRKHHRDSKYGVHNGNTKLDLELKAAAQKAYMDAHNATTADFIRRYGKSWLET